jgi:hypothetical protein
MKSITIHGLDDDLDEQIRHKAEAAGLSLNKTIKLLVREALGMADPCPDRRQDFQDLFGAWTAADLEALEPSRPRPVSEQADGART